MNKINKIIWYVLMCFTLICFAAFLIIANAISGDKLLYLNSELGYIYAVSFRPICLASGILVIFWIIMAIRKRNILIAKLLSLKEKHKKQKMIFCSYCGKQLIGEKKFCPFCGKPIGSINKSNNS